MGFPNLRHKKKNSKIYDVWEKGVIANLNSKKSIWPITSMSAFSSECTPNDLLFR